MTITKKQTQFLALASALVLIAVAVQMIRKRG